MECNSLASLPSEPKTFWLLVIRRKDKAMAAPLPFINVYIYNILHLGKLIRKPFVCRRVQAKRKRRNIGRRRRRSQDRKAEGRVEELLPRDLALWFGRLRQSGLHILVVCQIIKHSSLNQNLSCKVTYFQKNSFFLDKWVNPGYIAGPGADRWPWC